MAGMLEHMTQKKRLKIWLSSVQRRPKEHPRTASCHPTWGYRGDGDSVSSETHTEKRQQTKAAAREILARYEEKFHPHGTGTATKKVLRGWRISTLGNVQNLPMQRIEGFHQLWNQMCCKMEVRLEISRGSFYLKLFSSSKLSMSVRPPHRDKQSQNPALQRRKHLSNPLYTTSLNVIEEEAGQRRPQVL